MVITTLPSVEYHVHTKNQGMIIIHSPSEMPERQFIERIEEPYIKAIIITLSSSYIGNVIKLCIDKRGIFKNQSYISTDRVELIFENAFIRSCF